MLTVYTCILIGYLFTGELSLGLFPIILGVIVAIVAIAAKVKKKETIDDGSVGIIKIFGRKIRSHVLNEGDFLKIPFVRIDSFAVEYDNIDLEYSDVQTKDGVCVKGKVTIERDLCDIFKVQDVEKATKDGVTGRIKPKALELIKLSMDNIDIEELLETEDGSDKLIKVMKKEISKMASFEDAHETFLESRSTRDGVYAYFPDSGMNLRFIVQTHAPQNEEMDRAFDNISIAEAGIKEARFKAKGRAEAEKIRMETQREILKDTIDQMMEAKDESLTRAQAVENAMIVMDSFNDEKIVRLSGTDGEKLRLFEAAIASFMGSQGFKDKPKSKTK